jgi:hypothetical protein
MRRVDQLTLTIVIAVAVSTTSSSQTFTQTCADPSFPSKATAIDSACDVAGQGGKEAAQG